MIETDARLIIQGAMELAAEIVADTDGWTVAEITYVGEREGVARYRLRAIKGGKMIETREYVPWEMLKRHSGK